MPEKPSSTELDRFASMLPEGGHDRALITQFTKYATTDASCGHADFRLLAEGDPLACFWFDGDAETAKQFVAFGTTDNDGIFAYWVYDGATPEIAPIVFLGSEGAAKVIANNFLEFLLLLAVPRKELEFTFSDDAWCLQSKMTDELEAFRKWLSAECGIQPLMDVSGLVANAQSRHPSLLMFVEKWAAAWFD